MAKKSSPTKRGRPTGSRNKPRDTARVTPSRCRECGSTDRTPYTYTRRKPWAGVDREGQPCTHVVWRHTTCAACGQARVDRSLEYRTDAPPRVLEGDAAESDAPAGDDA